MIDISEYSLTYVNTGRKVLEKVSLSIPKGSIVALLGPSGSGKTTLLKSIAGLFEAHEVSVSGEISFTVNKPVIRSVFQTPLLLPWRTVRKNVEYGLELAGAQEDESIKKSLEVLNMVGLEDRTEDYPHQLSYGMQQRVNFARAVVLNPDILLLDEPFSALDGETKIRIQDDFSRIVKEMGITTLFVTHNLEEAQRMADIKKTLIVSDEGFATIKD